MKNYIYISISLTLMAISCKNRDTIQKEGFVIEAHIPSLPSSSLAVLSYTQKDSTLTDTVAVKEGMFTFTGKVSHPIEASINVRHGETYPDKSYLKDTFTFYLDNNDMQISATDSIKNASISGSLLTDQSIAFSKQINPLRQKIQDLSWGLQGKAYDDAYMATVDTIKATGKQTEELVRKFVEAHPDSYFALTAFTNYELGYNFDPIWAEEEYQKFTDEVRNTPLGQRVYDKILTGKRTSVGEEAMEFSQTTLQGDTFSLNALRGNYVFIDFWASWCVPCRQENPFIVEAYNEFKDRNFEIVGVSVDDKRKNWEFAVEKDKLPWINVSDLKGFKNEVAKQYGISAVPQNFLLDPDGVIIAKNMRGEELSEKLSEIFHQE
ncbi:TlpA disulfide reductase family protein [Anditalea andensis]|uniref:Thioredoxin domain-containing protein n=1 Tax=Anditalea andensis TaxID=1048983 RepID=A0A074KZ93_9BACT|nr:TlpA disulfide reductase family protein [Anditalea andensis]KEO74234.1 hypothetical protein EL17_08865 [Anditalea andensis]